MIRVALGAIREAMSAAGDLGAECIQAFAECLDNLIAGFEPIKIRDKIVDSSIAARWLRFHK